MKKQFVYFIHEEGNTEVFKIGCTKLHPSERLIALSTGNPRRLIIYRWIETENCKQLEEDLHSRFVNLHIRGEWFYLSTEVVDHVISEGKYTTSTPYPKWTDEDIIQHNEHRRTVGGGKSKYSPRTQMQRKRDYITNLVITPEFEDDL